MPLHYAAEKNNKKIGQFLISKGDDINARDNQCKTPLSHNCDWIK